jgi:hypothetical protein
MRLSLDDIPWLESLFGFPRDNRASTAENNWISFKKKPLSLWAEPESDVTPSR